MKIILIGNYQLDRQESMDRFADMLVMGLRKTGLELEFWRPVECFGAMAKSTTSGVGKWIGYIDKWLLYPIILWWRVRRLGLDNKAVLFHICDHSNAPYLQFLPNFNTGITCHDVLAIRGALGDKDTHCKASLFGKILQKWILKYLLKANRLAAVSEQTLHQLQNLAQVDKTHLNTWRVIHNAFNAEFRIMEEQERNSLLHKAGINPKEPFVLHVGSGLPRKNRKLLLDMVDCLGSGWNGNICFAGEAPDKDLVSHVYSLSLQERVYFVVSPSHSTLVALYNGCEAFIFPSFSEGFGWPLIEAQACGAPVIASNIEPMPEVSGGAALHVDPSRPQDFAQAFNTLQNEDIRSKLIKLGLENALRFQTKQMIESYLELYGLGSYKSDLHVA
ncbi:glycosyltransferase family 4 protein [Pontibacter toksunensis]|uniref:Glycosyltransferase family 4 protein n=1 Tax=Pontibacter toksunensis TaxID=1332631 RepID=A0ABW6C0Q8_9BACT